MFAALHKSKQLYIITLDRIGDYLDLLRVEIKIREQQIAFRIAGFTIALLFTLLATVFLGLAIIISFWSSEYRTLAAWFVVLLYGGIAGVAFNLCLKHFRSPPLGTTMRSELQHDLDVIKDSL
ncbi:MAG TPA: phage holin family protein [Noviherbaspirillum sp.]|uniref:phage holin family protein n=1 Tax=Noviherbaspirillum sp. TaxID=1926288 RepID=UPI002B49D5A8|nr:phage holin family protein [Noviherbaspirillum sp.]HJV86004.1 phage holin family protein [Noviherbaspirillum sp.]